MRHGHGVAPFLLAFVLFLPPFLNVCYKLYQLKTSKSPEAHSFGSGQPHRKLDVPQEIRRGDYIPARVIDFSSPSVFRSTFFITYSSKHEIRPGTVVIAPPWTLAGLVVKVWSWTRVALVKNIDDQLFRVSCTSAGKEVILQGNGEGLGLHAITESYPFNTPVEFRTSGNDFVFPAKLSVGFSREGENGIDPLFSVQRNSWVYLWFDTDFERVKKQVELKLKR